MSSSQVRSCVEFALIFGLLMFAWSALFDHVAFWENVRSTVLSGVVAGALACAFLYFKNWRAAKRDSADHKQ